MPEIYACPRIFKFNHGHLELVFNPEFYPTFCPHVNFENTFVPTPPLIEIHLLEDYLINETYVLLI